MSTSPMTLFPQATKVQISLNEKHELVQFTEMIEWDGLISIAGKIRHGKIKKATGPQPHYRELLGAVALMAVKPITFRDAEDLVSNYAPAKYLCKMMESSWRMDHVTIFEFTQMLGPEGTAEINQHILKTAQSLKLIDPKELMSDTTAQEAKITYPNEVGLMARYAEIIKKNIGKAGTKFRKVKSKLSNAEKKIKGLVRNSHLFAKTKEEKTKVAKKLFHVIDGIHKEIKKVVKGKNLRTRASQEITRITKVMDTLLPQMLHFIETGFVASKKIIHLQMSELAAIVRGKSGKKVEFGLKWGINRIAGGFIQGF